MVKKLLQSCWFMWPSHEIVVDVSEPFSGFVICLLNLHGLVITFVLSADLREPAVRWLEGGVP
jgi:hypothetical protein